MPRSAAVVHVLRSAAECTHLLEMPRCVGANSFAVHCLRFVPVSLSVWCRVEIVQSPSASALPNGLTPSWLYADQVDDVRAQRSSAAKRKRPRDDQPATQPASNAAASAPDKSRPQAAAPASQPAIASAQQRPAAAASPITPLVQAPAKRPAIRKAGSRIDRSDTHVKSASAGGLGLDP